MPAAMPAEPPPIMMPVSPPVSPPVTTDPPTPTEPEVETPDEPDPEPVIPTPDPEPVIPPPDPVITPPPPPPPPPPPMPPVVQPQADPVTVTRPRDPLPDLTTDDNRVFRIKPEDVPDDAEPQGLARHLIDGRTWIMPHQGKLQLKWYLEVDDALLVNGNTVETVRQRVERALREFEGAANVEYIEITDPSEYNTAHFRVEFDYSATATQASAGLPNENIPRVFFRNDKLEDIDHSTIVHELAHVMGLSHPHDARNGWPGDEAYRETPNSILSYWDGWDDNDNGLQAADIEALQFLYGAPDADVNRGAGDHLKLTEERSLTSSYWHAVLQVQENIDPSVVLYDGHDAQEDREVPPHRFELYEGEKDNHLFTIDATTGEIRFKESPDFENPQDTHGGARYGYNNFYEIDGRGVFFITPTIEIGFGIDIVVEVVDIPHAADPVTVSRNPPIDRTADGNFAFRLRPEDVPDDEEPTGLARHLIGGETWAMPLSGPLQLSWFLGHTARRYPDAGTMLDTDEKIAAAKVKIENALAQFAAVINVEFTEITDPSKAADADLRFAFVTIDGVTGGQASDPDEDGADIAFYQADLDSVYHSLMMHEIAHALGLAHPHDDGDGLGWPGDARYRNSDQTIMSYWDGWDEAANRNSGLQPADIEALQWLYGAPDADVNRGAGNHLKLTEERSLTSSYWEAVLQVQENIATSEVIYDGHDARSTRLINEREEPHRFELDEDEKDNHAFTIDATTGEIRFKESPDFENPQDTHGGARYGYNNFYELSGLGYYYFAPGLEFTYIIDVVVQVVDIP